MSARYCHGQPVMPGRFCGTCGTGYARLPLARSAAVMPAAYDDGPSLGIDVTDGDLVLNMGNGLGVDLSTGEVELDLGGFDVPLD